jgi:hypothetical protein
VRTDLEAMAKRRKSQPPKPEPVTRPGPPPAELAELPPPPADPLEAAAYVHRALMITFFDAARDTKIGARERRKELRTIAAAASKSFPDARRWEAVQLIKSHQAALDRTKAARRGMATLEPLPEEPADADDGT